jgi:tyrosine-protein kinase Etk/Wzc
MLGGVAIFIRGALNQGVRDPAVVEQATGLPTYASVPFAAGQAALFKQREAKKADHAILAVADPQSVSVESLRSLRSALHFALSDAPNNIVMLTGPSPGLGKSFVSINLAATLAASGKRVVVVDADMRRGHIHTMTGAERAPGLSDVISGSVTLEKALVPARAQGLYLLSTGTIPPNPSELLLKKEFADLLKQLSSSFDLVLVDTPPVLAVADAAVVGSLAGTTLIVLKTGEHPLRMIEDTVRRLRAAGVAVRGTIFNQTEESKSYVGSKYGYQYGYYHYEYKNN